MSFTSVGYDASAGWGGTVQVPKVTGDIPVLDVYLGFTAPPNGIVFATEVR